MVRSPFLVQNGPPRGHPIRFTAAGRRKNWRKHAQTRSVGLKIEGEYVYPSTISKMDPNTSFEVDGDCKPCIEGLPTRTCYPTSHQGKQARHGRGSRAAADYMAGRRALRESSAGRHPELTGFTVSPRISNPLKTSG